MKPHLYYKNCLELWNTGYKYHFVCFNCKISWKKCNFSENEVCIKCQKSVRNVGLNFRVPRKSASNKYWNKLEKMVNDEHIIFEKPHSENMVCKNHKHIYWQGNETTTNFCQIPFRQYSILNY